MAMQDPQAEPSMEEILASIRRIISEEDQPAPVLDLNQPAEAEPEDDIMVFEEQPAARAPAPAPQPAPAPAPVAAPIEPAPAPPPPRAAYTPPVEEDIVEEPILSAPAAHVAADAFSRLASNVRVAEAPGQTLEGIIRQLVRPMLKEWLDQNLPAIVEAKVEAELDRISRLAR
jgi:cell pole-organizing protein PopZ